jgi:hypothetical protein
LNRQYSSLFTQILEYFREAPSPLGSKPFPYNENSIKTLVERLRPYSLATAELLMIMNLRPANVSNLNTVVEEMTDRFSDEQQEEIVAIIGDVLGRPDGAAERQAMTDNAKEAREEEIKQIGQEEVMDVDA